MAFDLTPVVPRDPAQAGFLQFQSAGVDLGDRGVEVFDVVADPGDVQMTRGVGENSHVVTLRRITPGDPQFDSAVLIWNMRDAIGTSPPADQSKYRKVHTPTGALRLLRVDSADGPFPGCGSCIQIYDNDVNYPRRAYATDSAWDFNAATQTLTNEGWVKVAAVNASNKTHLIRVMHNGGGSWWWPWFQRVAGTVMVGLDVVGLTPINVSAGVPAGAWVHYVAQHTGGTIYLGVNGVRVGSYAYGASVMSDFALQSVSTVTGGAIGAGLLMGPHRVSLVNRYQLQANATYSPPTDRFPVYLP